MRKRATKNKTEQPKVAPPDVKGGPADVKFSFEGLPFEGPRVDLKDTDEGAAAPAIGYRAHVVTIDTNNKESVKLYEKILQAATEGKVILSSEDKQYDPDEKFWRILVTYSDIFYHIKKEV
jgi:hypothetical protein